MSIENARAHLRKFDMEHLVREFDVSSATVALAAQALGVEGARIAKTLSFMVNGRCVLIVTAGDTRVDNKRFKAFFGVKAKMCTAQEAQQMTGHAVGGVCPFGVPEDVDVYADISLKRFDTIYPACGSGNSCAALTPEQLEQAALSKQWIDVC